MNRKFPRIFLVLTVCALVAGMSGQIGRSSAADSVTQTVLTPRWTTGATGAVAGEAGIVVQDLDGDGVSEIAACLQGYFDLGHVFVLNHTGAGDYKIKFYSPDLGCKVVAAGDRNNDGTGELYVANEAARITILDGVNFQVQAAFDLPDDSLVQELLVEDVDGDGAKEIALVSDNALSIYDANSLALEWYSVGLGGWQIALGNVDGDARLELVVGNVEMRVIDPVSRTLKWSLAQQAYLRLAVGNVDGDAFDEIVYSDYFNGLVVLDGESRTNQWVDPDFKQACDVAITDLDGVGADDVLVGATCQGSLTTGLRGSDGALLGSIAQEEIGALGIEVGDADQDGEDEILWNAQAVDASGRLMIGSWQTKSVEWRSELLNGPLYVASGDLDGDGQKEIVTAGRLGGAFPGSIVSVYSGSGQALLWEWRGAGPCQVFLLEAAQLDGDPALEILLGCSGGGGAFLRTLDGSSRVQEWASAPISQGPPVSVLAADIDNNSGQEILIAQDSQRVIVLAGASDVVNWDSGPLDDPIRDLALGELDGDGWLDLAVLTSKNFHVFKTGTWEEKPSRPVEYGKAIAIRPAPAGQAGQLAIAAGESDGAGFQKITLKAWEGDTLQQSWQQSWQRSIGQADLSDLLAEDVDADGIWELIVLGQRDNRLNGASLLCIGAPENASFCEYDNVERWSNINSFHLDDLDQDGQNEALWSSSQVVQVSEITTRSAPLYRAFFPMVSLALPRAMYGWVTENGLPAAGVEIEQRVMPYRTWEQLATTLTGEDGGYYFPGTHVMPTGLDVRYVNPKRGGQSGDLGRLALWNTRGAYYPAESFYHIGDFDLANVELGKPADGEWIRLPAKFEWQARPNFPNDVYELHIYDPADDRYYDFKQNVGHSTSFVLTHVPDGLAPDKVLKWEVWVLAPDGGHGVSYETREVTFTNWGSP